MSKKKRWYDIYLVLSLPKNIKKFKVASNKIDKRCGFFNETDMVKNKKMQS